MACQPFGPCQRCDPGSIKRSADHFAAVFSRSRSRAFVGCLLANLLTGAVFWDILFGSLATLLGALGTLAVPRDKPYLAPLPPILANMVIVPLVLRYAYQAPGALPYLMATVGIGEVLSCGILGMGLFWALKKRGMLPGNKTDSDPAR